MKTAIYYFSGTGNTERVVKTWIRALEAEGVSSGAFRIEDVYPSSESRDLKEELSSYDKIGIAYPIHAFNAPKIVLDFAEKLPVFPSEKPFFLIMVGGEPLRLNDSSDQKLKGILKKKNAVTESRWHYIMPYNMIFRHTEKRAFEMNRTMEELVPLDVREYVREGKKHRLRPIKGTALLTAAFRIEQIFSPINGKHFRVTARCVQCMQCIQNCPTGNIEYQNGRFLFRDRCVLCTRCSFNCPVDAIRIGLLNNWRVNGPYRFLPPETEEPDRHAAFCRRSYENYFRTAKERLRDDLVKPEQIGIEIVLPEPGKALRPEPEEQLLKPEPAGAELIEAEDIDRMITESEEEESWEIPVRHA